MARSILVVRLGALGDLVHALPAVAALRAEWPDARIDWLVDRRYAALLGLVPVIDRAVVFGLPEGDPLGALVRRLRGVRYDLAIDFQGLLKSAVLARLSGARTVAGFVSRQLREPAAGLFYNTRIEGDDRAHVVHKNLSLVVALGVTVRTVASPLRVSASGAPEKARELLSLSAGGRFAVVNPGAGWPNKQWPAGRYGRIAGHLHSRHGLRSIVTWGPQERRLAEEVAAASGGAAVPAPPTTIADLVELCRAASLVIGGDTGPLQLAAAVGTPVVGIFGPTNPARNGPWSAGDLCVSRFDDCECHHKRRCRRRTPCIDTIAEEEVAAIVDRRLAGGGARG